MLYKISQLLLVCPTPCSPKSPIPKLYLIHCTMQKVWQFWKVIIFSTSGNIFLLSKLNAWWYFGLMFPLSQCKDFVCAFAMQMCVQVQHGISFGRNAQKISSLSSCDTIPWLKLSFHLLVCFFYPLVLKDGNSKIQPSHQQLKSMANKGNAAQMTW